MPAVAPGEPVEPAANLRGPERVGVAERPSAKRGKAGAHDHCEVYVSRGANDLLLEAPRGLVDDRKDKKVHDSRAALELLPASPQRSLTSHDRNDFEVEDRFLRRPATATGSLPPFLARRMAVEAETGFDSEAAGRHQPVHRAVRRGRALWKGGSQF